MWLMEKQGEGRDELSAALGQGLPARPLPLSLLPFTRERPEAGRQAGASLLPRQTFLSEPRAQAVG